MLKTSPCMNPDIRMPPASPDYAALRRQRNRFGEASVPRQTLSRCFEASLPDSITARRNVLAALWAGRLMGLPDDELTRYASDARFVGQRDERIVGMLADDLQDAGILLPLEDIQQALSRFHRVALHQTCVTD